MKIVDDFPNLIKLYQSDLLQFDRLNESQEQWLGVVIISEKILLEITSAKELNEKRQCDQLLLTIFRKINEIISDFTEYHLNKEGQLIAFLKTAVEEIIIFKQSLIPIKKTCLNQFIGEFSAQPVFELVCYLWSLPIELLQIINDEGNDNIALPGIDRILTEVLSLDTVRHFIDIFDQFTYFRNVLVQSYLGYVVFFSHHYSFTSGMDYEDIIQEGNLGLLKAVEKYDVRRGNKFKTYAVWWIRQAITRSIAEDSRTIRLPVHMHEEVLKLMRLITNNNYISSAELTRSILADKSDLTEKKVKQYLTYTYVNVPYHLLEYCEDCLSENNDLDRNVININYCFNCPWVYDNSGLENRSYNLQKLPICLITDTNGNIVWTDNSVTRLLNDLSIDETENWITKIYNQELMSVLQESFSVLDARTLAILKLRFGIDNNQQMTLNEIANKYELTRERIRQIEAKAFTKLRHPTRILSFWNKS